MCSTEIVNTGYSSIPDCVSRERGGARRYPLSKVETVPDKVTDHKPPERITLIQTPQRIRIPTVSDRFYQLNICRFLKNIAMCMLQLILVIHHGANIVNEFGDS